MEIFVEKAIKVNILLDETNVHNLESDRSASPTTTAGIRSCSTSPSILLTQPLLILCVYLLNALPKST